MFTELEERQMAFEELLRNQSQEFQMQMVRILVGHHPYVGSSNQSQFGMHQPPNPPYKKDIINPMNLSEVHMQG